MVPTEDTESKKAEKEEAVCEREKRHRYPPDDQYIVLGV